MDRGEIRHFSWRTNRLGERNCSRRGGDKRRCSRLGNDWRSCESDGRLNCQVNTISTHTSLVAAGRSWLASALPRRLALGAVAGAGASAISMLVAFATVPLALNYLGSERYGLWMAASSLVLLLGTFADGGIVYSLITASAVANARGGAAAVREIVGSAWAVLVPIAGAIILVTVALVPLVPWQWVFSLSNAGLAREAADVVRVVIIGLALSFLVNVALKVRTGLQEIAAVRAWEGAAALAALPALLLAIQLETSMAWLVAAIVGAPLLVKGLTSILFFRDRPQMRPGREDIGFKHARYILGAGSAFFIIQLSQAVAIQSDQVLIANLIGIEQVVAYSVMQRLFSIPYILANFVFAAQWPAFSDAAARGDLVWIRRSFLRVLAMSLAVAVILTLGLALMHRPLLSIWGVAGAVRPGMTLVAGMAVYAVLAVIVGACSTLLISLDMRRPQIWISLAMMVVNLTLSIILIREIGSAGAVWGTAISYLVCMVVPYAVIILRLFREFAPPQGAALAGHAESKSLSEAEMR